MADEKLGKYGHHPDPIIDAEVEAEIVEGRLCEPWAEIGEHPSRAARDLFDRLASVAPKVQVSAPGGKVSEVFVWQIARERSKEVAGG